MNIRIFVFLLWFSTCRVFSATYYVDDNQAGDSFNGTSWSYAKKTIQAAVDLASAGDTVLVAAGTYSLNGAVAPGSMLTNRVLINKAITVKAVDGPDQTTILGASDNGSFGPAAVRGAYLTDGAVLQGFKISESWTMAPGTGGTDDDDGAGVYLAGGGELIDCVINRNRAGDNGGGIRFHNGGLADRCVIAGNTADDNGGGVFFYQGGELCNSLVVANVATNEAGGIRFSDGGLTRNCTISKNTAGGDGGGVAVYGSGTNRNTIIWANSGSPNQNFSGGTYRYCCLPAAMSGDGNIVDNPLFVDPDNDLHLQENSPLRLAGYAGSARGELELDGYPRITPRGEVDIGCYQWDLFRPESGADLPNPGLTPTTAWGDYDNDGDLDVFWIKYIYRNNGDRSFTRMDTAIQGLYGTARWGDYDNDGDLDLLVAGWSGSSGIGYVTALYRNDSGGIFSAVKAGFPGLRNADVAWGDYDNDGDLDLFMTGYDADNDKEVATLYENRGGVFRSAAEFSGVQDSSVAWGDYDHDGDLDVLLSGEMHLPDGTALEYTRIWRNDNGHFSTIDAGLPGVAGSDVAWGDYDNDGDLDILLAGCGDFDPSFISRIYRNDGGNVFSDIHAGLPGVAGARVAWGDYDNDGDLDVLLCGYNNNYETISRIYRNDDGSFTDIHTGLLGTSSGHAEWGDYDNDDDLDILLCGYTGSNYFSRIYRNDGNVFNSPPAAPTGLTASRDSTGTEISFFWNAATDAQTSADGLMYNLRISTNSLGDRVKSGMADTNGWRRIPAIGNVNQVTNWTVKGGDPGIPYYWSVQAVDPSLAGGAWSAEGVVPEWKRITASYGLHGIIRPSGSIWVEPGGSVVFTNSPDTYWHVADVQTNGASVGAPDTVTWSNITADGTIHVDFAADLASGGTPHWWLADHGFTNGFDAAETNNPDGDAFVTADEYVADTDPLDSNDCFRITAVPNNVGSEIFFDSSTARLYTLQSCTNLTEGSWTDIVGPRSGIAGADSMSDTNSTPARFFRVEVSLP